MPLSRSISRGLSRSLSRTLDGSGGGLEHGASLPPGTLRLRWKSDRHLARWKSDGRSILGRKSS